MIKKIEKLIKNQYFMLIILSLLALSIRLLNIDKSYGLWYDEMLTYIVSSKSFPVGIMETLLKQDFHMPLYYFYIHIWIKLFGTSDVCLRCSSVIWGVFSIPAFFYLGKEFKSDKFGYLLASIACLSPIMIYYSQEFRFYSILIFFATISLIFFLKLLENPGKKNFLIFGFSNLIILYINTIGIFFVAPQVIILLAHFYKYKKDSYKDLIKYILLFFVLSIPYLILFFIYLFQSTQTLIISFPSSNLTRFLPLYLFNDLLSPSLAGIYGNIGVYEKFFKTLGGITNFICLSITSICFLAGFFVSLIKINRKILYLFLIFLTVAFSEILMAVFSDFMLMSRYMLMVLPILILICTYGLVSIRVKSFRVILLGIIFTLFIYNVINHNNMPSFWNRIGGYTLPAAELNKLKINKNDYVLYPNRTELLKKYINNVNFIDFDIPGIMYLDKTKHEALKVFDKDFVINTNKRNAARRLVPYLSSTKPTPQLYNYVNSFVERVPKGSRIFVLDNLHLKAKPDIIVKITSVYKNKKISEKDYKSTLFLLTYSKILNDIITAMDENTSIRRINQCTFTVGHLPQKKNANWHFFIYEKIK